MTAPRDWPELLSQLSDFRLLIDRHAEFSSLSPEVHESGSLLRAPAPESLITLTEERLGMRFPPSYREFLSCSNGMEALGDITFPGQLWAVEEVRTLREQDGQLIDIVAEFHSPEEMKPMESAVAISEHGDACDLFLCPELTRSHGEMECWTWASWTPGEMRYASFEAWMLWEWADAAQKWQTIERFGTDGWARFDEILVAGYPVEDARDLGARLELFRAEAQQNPDLALWVPDWLGLIDFNRKSEALEKRLQTLRHDFWESKIVNDREIVGGTLQTLPARMEKRRAQNLELLDTLQVRAARWTI